jgi:hypothetical protein
MRSSTRETKDRVFERLRGLFGRTVEKPVYVPVVKALDDGKYEQRFAAGCVSLDAEHGFVHLGLTEEESSAVHGLIIATPQNEPFSPSDVYVEFNDQGNACSGADIALSLGGAQLVVEFSDDVEMWVSRLSYSAAADSLSDPEEDYAFPLRRVAVNLQVPAETIETIARELERMRRNGVRVVLERVQGEH